MPTWTKAQQSAIYSESKHIICSAAAGSGKTAVMVERIFRRIQQGAEPDSFLVITFTNASAAEMKERIRSRFYQEIKDPVIQSAFDQIDQMQISTIHSFCQQLIRDYFQLIEIDPNFKICENSQRQQLFHESFTDACNELEINHDDVFKLLKKRFDLKKAEQIVLEMDHYLMSLPQPDQWYRDKINSIPIKMNADHPWFHTILEMAADEIYKAEILLKRMYDMLSDPFAIEAYRETWKKDSELFHVKQNQVRDEAAEKSKSEFSRLKLVKGLNIQESDWKERYTKIRDDYKKSINKIDDLLMTDTEKVLMEWKNIRETLEAFQLLLSETEKRFQQKKKARGLVDFHDMEQYAVQILMDDRGREEAQATWRNIFVDECQDISAIQDKIIELLSSSENHLYMVGDVKQSIYRFRLADPTLLMKRIRNIAENKEEKSECIYLQSNFRSRPEILETTNRVFESVMKEKVAEIEYDDSERLISTKISEDVPVQIIMIDKGESKCTDLEATASFLQDEINQLIHTEYREKGRNYEYRDCVILMPAVQTDGLKLYDLLTERDIPVFFDGGSEYYQLHEIQIIRNLLDWINEPMQDLPLISVLMESPFYFSEEELSSIRLKCPERNRPFYEAYLSCCEEASELGEKCRNVYQMLKQWQKFSETMSVYELLWYLYERTGIYYILGAQEDGEMKQANLRMLAQQASQAEANGIVTLRQFLSYMKEQQSYGDQQSATLLGDQDNLVRIMTIHKSKGLQFPVVFCAGMDRAMTRSNTSEVMLHTKLGICVNYKDPENRISRPTMATEIFSWKKRREELAEKIRLLYVAMTRPQERLYLLTCEQMNPLWSMPEGNGRVLAAKTYTDLWMPVIWNENEQNLSTGYTQGEKPYMIRVYEINQQKSVEKETNIHSLSSWLDSVISAPVVDELWKKEAEESTTQTMLKRSVTSLIRSAREKLRPEEEEEEEETAEKKRMPDQLRQRLEREDLAEMPAFMKEQGKITAAWRGTLNHRILSQMNLDRIRQGEDVAEVLQAEKERMIQNHVISEEEWKQVKEEQIISFWNQKTGKRILASPEVHREWNFNLEVDQGQHMMLQGVIDCAFMEENEWVILDYKTDRGRSVEELREEYRPQLEWYARALEELTGRRVKEASVFSLSLNQLIPII